MLACSVSRFFDPKKRKKSAKTARKSASLIFQNFYCFFGFFVRFRSGLFLAIIFPFVNFFLNKVNFYYTKRLKNQKALLIFVFVLCANCKNHGAKEGQKAPLLREIARPGHIASMNFFLLSSLYLVCAAPHVCILAVND